MKKDILIAGVGGQGVIFASRLIAVAAMESGETVQTAKSIGMAQRGGCVVSHVRIGGGACSPMIPPGEADLLIALEIAEAARNLNALKPEGACVADLGRIFPAAFGRYELAPVEGYLRAQCPGALLLEGSKAARELGSAKALNLLLVGACDAMGFLAGDLEATIRQNTPKIYLELNLMAYEMGKKLARKGKRC